jgi:Carboxypeptidase regulatory-like domain
MKLIRRVLLLSSVLASVTQGLLESIEKNRKYMDIAGGSLVARLDGGATATLAALFLFSGLLFGQIETGTIAGQVKDASGAVIPGVKVEASSPALIEKSRTVITDGQGLYKIIDLRPGTYTVAFTAPGFTVFQQKNVELVAAFTANVNAQLTAGTVQQTVNVEATAPLVDVQNVLSQNVMNRTVMDEIPTARGFQDFAVLTPGMTTTSQDVGGTFGDTSIGLTIHGGRVNDMELDLNGMSAQNGFNRGGVGSYGMYVDNGMMQEFNVETGGMSAETEIGGVRVNLIAKEGSNQFHGSFYVNYSDGSLESGNLNSQLMSDGLKTVNSLKRSYDYDFSFGGPILKNKIWFFTSMRYWGVNDYEANLFTNANSTSMFYTPSTTKAYNYRWHTSFPLNLTVQTTSKSKLAFYYEFEYPKYTQSDSPSESPEAWEVLFERPQYLAQISWTDIITPRLLVDVGATLSGNNYMSVPNFGAQVASAIPGSIYGLPAVDDLGLNFTYRALYGGGYGFNRSDNYNGRVSLTYVTGSHAFKVGVSAQSTWAYQTDGAYGANPVGYVFDNQVPVEVSLNAFPISYREREPYNLGPYAQDQWKIRRLTLNYGVRFDFLNGQVEAQSLAAGPFTPARSFAEVPNVPNWKNISPRLGAAYDLFGNGKTAIKGEYAGFVVGYGTSGFARLANPMYATINSTTRSWDPSAAVIAQLQSEPLSLQAMNPVPDCNLTNPLANGACGPDANPSFGSEVITQHFSTALSQGWFVRPMNWETSPSVTQEIRRGVAVTAAYFHRWYTNMTIEDNTGATAADFTPYCVTAPTNPRLGKVSGSEVCGFYDINPGIVSNYTITHASQYGNMQDVYDGFDLTINARLPHNAFVGGGVTYGRERVNTCFALNKPWLTPGGGLSGLADLAAGPASNGFVGSASGVTSPNQAAFCNIVPPFQPNVKLYGVYPLPWWGIQVSATYQGLPGPQITASYAVTAANNPGVAATLGRNLTAGSAIVDLIPPGTMYAARLNETDFRLSKKIKLNERLSLRADMDVYNLFNASSPLTVQTRYTSTNPSAWGAPLTVLPGRLVKFGGQFYF